MRHRSIILSQPAVSHSYDKIDYAGTCSDPWYSTIVPYSTTWVQTYHFKEMEDVEIENFYVRRSKGEVFCNPMTSTETMIEEPPCYVDRAFVNKWNACSPVKTLYGGQRWTGEFRSLSLLQINGTGIAPWAPQPNIDVTRLCDLAVTRAWSRCDLSEVSSLVTIGEGKETFNWLFSIFKRASKIKRDLKKLRLREVYQSAKAIRKSRLKFIGKGLLPRELANDWMEARYAIRPLVFELLQWIDAINAKIPKAARLTFRGQMAEEASSNASWTFTGPGNQIRDVIGTAKREVTVRAGVLTDLRNCTWINIYGLDKGIDAIWDLLPLSFVWDWFWNVGETIASWTPEWGLTPLASWYVVNDTTCYVTQLVSARNTGGPYSHWDYYDVTGAVMSKVITSRYRVPSPHRPIIPRFKVNLNWAKILDLAIIFKQR